MTSFAHRVTIVVVALLATACSLTGTGDPGAAAIVGDTTIPAAPIDDSLDALSNSPAFQQQSQGDSSGSVILEARTQIVTTFVRSELLSMVAERNGIEVSDDEIDQSREELIASLGGEEAYEQRLVEQGLSDEFVVQQLRDRRVSELLAEQLGPSGDLAQFITTELADVPIEINPRYGQWNQDNLSVTPYAPFDARATQGVGDAPAGDGGAGGGVPEDGAPGDGGGE